MSHNLTEKHNLKRVRSRENGTMRMMRVPGCSMVVLCAALV